jgi:hypothetical protein
MSPRPAALLPADGAPRASSRDRAPRELGRGRLPHGVAAVVGEHVVQIDFADAEHPLDALRQRMCLLPSPDQDCGRGSRGVSKLLRHPT